MDPRLIPLDSSYLIVVRRNDKTSDDKVPNTLFPPHCFVWRFFDPMSIEIKTRLLGCNIYTYILFHLAKWMILVFFLLLEDQISSVTPLLALSIYSFPMLGWKGLQRQWKFEIGMDADKKRNSAGAGKQFCKVWNQDTFSLQSRLPTKHDI